MTDVMKAHLKKVQSPKRRRDAETLLELMRRVTGEEPRLWASVVGFGQYDYRYASGHEGTAPAAGFAPRKAATVVYLADGVNANADLLKNLGRHTAGVGCLYIKDLDDVDLEVLEKIIERSYQTLTAGTYTSRARDSE